MKASRLPYRDVWSVTSTMVSHSSMQLLAIVIKVSLDTAFLSVTMFALVFVLAVMSVCALSGYKEYHRVFVSFIFN